MNTKTEDGLPYAEGAKVPQKSQKEQPVENDWSHEIIGAAVEVQRVLGTGLLESAYAGALAVELTSLQLRFAREVPIDAIYKGQNLGVGYRTDFIVENSVIVELKAIDAVTEIHRAQLLSHLRLANLKLGLLINFNVFPVVKGIHRVVNKL
jgi:GxxExxY protein